MSKKTVLFTAEAFGFGPVSKMLAIAAEVEGVEKIFFGHGVAFDLAQLHNFDETHLISHEEIHKIEAILAQGDLLVNVMDFPLTSLVQRAGCRHFLVDSLFWFWPSLPQGVGKADVYFCQNFFRPVYDKIQSYHLENAVMIGPIVSDHFRKDLPPKKQVMVNFGGLENPAITIGKNSNYPFIMLENLLPILEKNFENILVTGRERVMKMCRERFGQSTKVEFKMLDQSSMLEALFQSEALFTAPGIQTFYDGADKLPIFFLPPQNNSNVKNLATFVEVGVAKHYLQWQEIYPMGQIEESFSESEEIREVLDALEQFGSNSKLKTEFQKRVRNFLGEKNTWPKLVRIQTEKLRSLGSRGEKTIASQITKEMGAIGTSVNS